MKAHLEREHGLHYEKAEAKAVVSSLRVINQQLSRQFWCGGCGQWLELIGSADERWHGRWNHVEDHFFGRKGMNIVTSRTWIPRPIAGPQTVTRSVDCRVVERGYGSSLGRSEASPTASRMRPSMQTARSALEPLQSLPVRKRHASTSPDAKTPLSTKKPKSDDCQPRSQDRDRDQGREHRGSRQHDSSATVTTSCVSLLILYFG